MKDLLAIVINVDGRSGLKVNCKFSKARDTYSWERKEDICIDVEIRSLPDIIPVYGQVWSYSVQNFINPEKKRRNRKRNKRENPS